jgi:GSCFA family
LSHPYKNLPDKQNWKKAISGKNGADLSFERVPSLTISRHDKIMTLGSCFAQHITRYLDESGFENLFTEIAPEDATDLPSYKNFTARYGNVYTTKQALQLFDRSFGFKSSSEEIWEKNGRFHDPHRPNVASFSNIDSLLSNRNEHLSYTRKAFAESSIIIFTLGLTEGWVNRVDNTYYPIAPGVIAGSYNPVEHKFFNDNHSAVLEDLEQLRSKIADVNPNSHLILTVSPVPLAATYENQHVIISSNYSKSVLRSAAEEMAKKYPTIDYFPSYDLITSQTSQGRYFESDFRHIHSFGITKAMMMFASDYKLEQKKLHTHQAKSEIKKKAFENLNSVICDEDLILTQRSAQFSNTNYNLNFSNIFRFILKLLKRIRF